MHCCSLPLPFFPPFLSFLACCTANEKMLYGTQKENQALSSYQHLAPHEMLQVVVGVGCGCCGWVLTHAMCVDVLCGWVGSPAVCSVLPAVTCLCCARGRNSMPPGGAVTEGSWLFSSLFCCCRRWVLQCGVQTAHTTGWRRHQTASSPLQAWRGCPLQLLVLVLLLVVTLWVSLRKWQHG